MEIDQPSANDFVINTSDNDENTDYVTGEQCQITIGFFYAAPDLYSADYIYFGEQTLRRMLELLEQAKNSKSED